MIADIPIISDAFDVLPDVLKIGVIFLVWAGVLLLMGAVGEFLWSLLRDALFRRQV